MYFKLINLEMYTILKNYVLDYYDDNEENRTP